jgi:serine/threonine-protein phosphatase 2A regulatory subunit A
LPFPYLTIQLRNIAAKHLFEFASILDIPEHTQELFAIMKSLSEDVTDYVRGNFPRQNNKKASFAANLLPMASFFQKKAVIKGIIPMFEMLLMDNCPEVRTNILKNLGDMIPVIGIETIQKSITPALKDLAENDNWRIRCDIARTLALIGR